MSLAMSLGRGSRFPRQKARERSQWAGAHLPKSVRLGRRQRHYPDLQIRCARSGNQWGPRWALSLQAQLAAWLPGFSLRPHPGDSRLRPSSSSDLPGRRL